MHLLLFIYSKAGCAAHSVCQSYPVNLLILNHQQYLLYNISYLCPSVSVSLCLDMRCRLVADV